MKNPIVKSTFIVFAFWWLVMTAIAVIATPLGLEHWEFLAAMVLWSLAACIGGAAIGFFSRLTWVGAWSIKRERDLKRGDRWLESISNLGELPRPKPPVMAGLPVGLDRLAPWLGPMKAKHPLHGAAAEAVLRVMMTEPKLPASPVPGGHGGRTLIEHSLGVVESMLEESPRWVYRGQFKANGKTLVVPPIRGPHRFGPDDLGLLILTALAHDIGKVACYKLKPNGRVQEVLPNHDAEGAKILRRLPEVMALPLADRRALLTACGYYHHPYAIPLAPWCDDRVRSLTELLIVADHATGRKEGHTLVYADDPEDAGEDQIPFTDLSPDVPSYIKAAFQTRASDLESNGGATLFDSDATEKALIAQIERREAARLSEPSNEPVEIPDRREAMEPRAAADSGRADIVGLYSLLQSKRNLINGNNPHGRIGFKQGEWLYISEPRLRDAVPLSDWDTGLSHSEITLDGRGRDTNPLTRRILDALSEAGYLMQELYNPIEKRKARFNAISAMWKIQTQINKSEASKTISPPFYAVRAVPFGVGDMEDWPWPVNIEGPFFGWHSEAGKPQRKDDPGDTESPDQTADEVDWADEESGDQDEIGDAGGAANESGAGLTSAASGSEPPKSEPTGDDPLADTPQGGDSPDKTEVQGSAAMTLARIRRELAESSLSPTHRGTNGEPYYYKDSAAGGLILRILGETKHNKDLLGIRYKNAASGRLIIILPADDLDPAQPAPTR